MHTPSVRVSIYRSGNGRCCLVASGVCAGSWRSGHAVDVVHPARYYRLYRRALCGALDRHYRRRHFRWLFRGTPKFHFPLLPSTYASASDSHLFVAHLAGAPRAWHTYCVSHSRESYSRSWPSTASSGLISIIHAAVFMRWLLLHSGRIRRHVATANGLTRRWSQPLAGVRSSFP